VVRQLSERRIHFPGLDALRLVAALSVLVQHVTYLLLGEREPYRFFETPFLQLKKRYSHIESGGDTLPVSGFAGPAGAVATSR
jgi:hypothetical protein